MKLWERRKKVVANIEELSHLPANDYLYSLVDARYEIDRLVEELYAKEKVLSGEAEAGNRPGTQVENEKPAA